MHSEGLEVNKEAQSVVVTLMGGLLISITVSGRYTSYVRPGFAPLLLIAGAILVVVGVWSLLGTIRRAVRTDRDAIAQAVAGPPRLAGPDEIAAAVAVTAAGAPVLTTAGAAAGSTVAIPAGSTPSGGRTRRSAADDEHGHHHGRARAPWLILAPVVVLLVMAPDALGADAVAHSAGSQAVAGLNVAPPVKVGGQDAAGGGGGGYAFNDGSGKGAGTAAYAKQRPTMQFAALPAGPDPTVGLKEFVMRALYEADDTVVNTPVTVTGFIAAAGDGYTDGYSIARMVISCCAADATPMRVHVPGGAAPVPENQWVTVVITAVPDTAEEANDYVPSVKVVSMVTASQPADPYLT